MPYGKILLSCGQHKYARRLILLDPKWLLETSREEDFAYGLENVSTQVYLKSVSGNRRVRAGHCAWNRTHGAVLMPDPMGITKRRCTSARTRMRGYLAQCRAFAGIFPRPIAEKWKFCCKLWRKA